MKRLMTAIAGGVFAGGVALAEPVAGVWKTEPGDSGGYLHVEIAPCGNAVCGTIVAGIDAEGRTGPNYEHLGKRMIWDMQAQGGGYYSNGKIWAADKDKTYGSKMQLEGDSLTVRGCVAGGLVCRGQVWQRLK